MAIKLHHLHPGHDDELTRLKAYNVVATADVNPEAVDNLGCTEWAAYGKDEVDAAIAELKDENRRLKRELDHVKNGDCINTCDVVEKHVKEEIKAKRALWLARGYIMTLLQRDFQRLAYLCNNDDYKKNLLNRRNRYYELSEKCLKKAEES